MINDNVRSDKSGVPRKTQTVAESDRQSRNLGDNQRADPERPVEKILDFKSTSSFFPELQPH